MSEEIRVLCQDKVAYSKHGADKTIKGKKLSRITKKKCRMYLCPICFNYHITTRAYEKFR